MPSAAASASARRTSASSGSATPSATLARTVPAMSPGRCPAQAISVESGARGAGASISPTQPTVPSAGSWPRIAWRRDDLPVPLGPVTAVTRPRGKVAESPASTGRSPRDTARSRITRASPAAPRAAAATAPAAAPARAARPARSSSRIPSTSSAAATPSAAAWNCTPTCRIGRNASGASSSTKSPTSRSSCPPMRRTPTDTATSATDSDAASSSTKPDRKEMRSTRMVSTRYSSVTRRMRAVCRRARPKARSGRQPVDHVEEARSQLGEARPLPPLHLLRRPADEHHEDGDHGQRREDGHARERVGQGEHRHDDRRRERREDQLRHVAREVRVERVESRAHDRREAPAAAAGRPGGAEVGDGPQRASPQLGGDTSGTASAHHVEEPCCRAAHDGGSDDEREHRPELRRGRAADRPHDELGERPAEGDERDGLHDADQGSRGEHRARRRGVPQQPRIQGLHGAPSARPGRSRRA